MFIHFGEKTGRFKVGRVATFCPICRDVAVHRLVSVRQQVHVQGLGIGRGKELHEETTCEACGLLRGVESGGFVGASRPRDKHSLEQVIEFSRPDLMEICAERFEMETRLDRLSAAERAGLISEAFTSVNYMYQLKSGEILRDVWFALLLSVFSVAGVALIILVCMARPPAVWPSVLLGIVGVLLVAMIWRGASTRKRYARRVVAPMLVRCLAPMNLSEGEVEMGMRQMDPKLQGGAAAGGEGVSVVLPRPLRGREGIVGLLSGGAAGRLPPATQRHRFAVGSGNQRFTAVALRGSLIDSAALGCVCRRTSRRRAMRASRS